MSDKASPAPAGKATASSSKATSSPAGNGAGGDAGSDASKAASPAEASKAKEALRTRLAANVRAKLDAKRSEGDGTPASSGKGGKSDAKPGKATAKAVPAKAKPKGKAEPEERDDDAEDGESEDVDPATAAKRAKRDLAKLRRRATSIEADLAGRKSQLEQAERAFVVRRDQTVKKFKEDPVAWLREHQVDVKKTLTDWVSEDGADPRDKAIKDAAETAADAKRRLDEQEAREKERRQAEARTIVAQHIGEAWDGVDADDYPVLSSAYERAQIAEMGTHMALEVYKRTKQELGPAEIFATLEETLREEDERGEAARAKRKQRKGDQATEDSPSEPPDRVRSVKSESPQARRSSGGPRAADVSNRETRQVAEEGRSRVDATARRERLVKMTRERLQR